MLLQCHLFKYSKIILCTFFEGLCFIFTYTAMKSSYFASWISWASCKYFCDVANITIVNKAWHATWHLCQSFYEKLVKSLKRRGSLTYKKERERVIIAFIIELYRSLDCGYLTSEKAPSNLYISLKRKLEIRDMVQL